MDYPMTHARYEAIIKSAGSMLLLAVGSFLVWPTGAHAGEPQFEVSAGRRQLFLDDVGIARIENLTRTMHQPAKRGAVIRSPQPTKTIQTRAAPVWDKEAELYKTWVITVDDNLWQSKDGLHWTPGPETNMRIMLAAYDPLDPDPARRFKAPLLNRGFAVSPDGVTWKQLELPKIQSSDEGNFSFDADHGLFIHTVKRGGKYGRAVALATSKDFETWDDFGLVFEADDRDQELGKRHIERRTADATLQQNFHDDPQVHNVDVYNMGVFRYESLYLGMPAMYHAVGSIPNYPNTDGFHLIQLVCSRDLRHWQRVGDRQTFLGPSRLDSGAYDLTQILPPSSAVVRDDELWFYYTGLKWRNTFKYAGSFPNGVHQPIPGRDRDGGAVCLAVLRRDGFVSLDAGEHEGTVLTEPFKLPGGRLLVNVDARHGGLCVEMFSEDGDVVARSEPLTGNLLREPVKWAEGEIGDWKGRTVSLRFTLQNGQFYSYWLE
jgi:hypothetical protein